MSKREPHRDAIRRARARRAEVERLRERADAEFVQALRGAREAGLPVAEIAEHAGVSRQAVYDHIAGLYSSGSRPTEPQDPDDKSHRTYWLKVSGTSEDPYDEADWGPRYRRWRECYGEVSMFPRRPRMTIGDRLILYAAGSHLHFGEGRIFALEEIVSAPEASEHERWPWQVRTRPLISGPTLEHCPTLSDIDLDPRSLRRQSHIRLSPRQGHRAERQLARAAKRKT